MENIKSRNQNITIPNALSVLRVILIPFFVYFFLVNKIIISVVFLFVSALSDALDGLIARKFNQITELGKILDPFADKLTQIAIAICIGVKFPLLSPLLAIFLFKEVAMVIMASKLISKSKKPCASKWYGKVGTTLFYCSAILIVGMYYFNSSRTIFLEISIIMLSLTSVVMIYSAVNYYKIYRHIVKSSAEKHEFNLEHELRKKKNY